MRCNQTRGLQRGDHEHEDGEQDRQGRQKRIAQAFPQVAK